MHVLVNGRIAYIYRGIVQIKLKVDRFAYNYP